MILLWATRYWQQLLSALTGALVAVGFGLLLYRPTPVKVETTHETVKYVDRVVVEYRDRVVEKVVHKTTMTQKPSGEVVTEVVVDQSSTKEKVGVSDKINIAEREAQTQTTSTVPHWRLGLSLNKTRPLTSLSYSDVAILGAARIGDSPLSLEGSYQPLKQAFSLGLSMEF